MITSRYRRILWFFARVILTFIGWEIILPRLGLRHITRRTRAERLRKIAVQFRTLAIQMGGVMIKVGQFLSARLDVLPLEITDELAGLQDEVLPEPFEAIRKVIESETNTPLEARYASFQTTALAAASIGQVHQARVNGADLPQVVVKVQRPDIQAIVDTDLAALRVVSRWIHYYPPIRKRVNVPALLEEFSRSLNEEIDYLNEGKNAETFAANFAGQAGVRVPHVIWSHTTRRVLTLEEIQAIKITDYAQISAAGIDRAEVAERLINTYLKQIFEDRFFHADPHPGNLFILPAAESEAGWQLVFVDFGMTGTIIPKQLDALREMLIGVGTQDVPRLIRSYQTMGILLPGADVPLLEKATRAAFDRFWGKSTAEMVNLGHQEAVAFAKEFGELLYEMPFQVPENLILLGRCLGILSGICSGLNPDFNVWVSVMPYARRLVEAEGGKGLGVVLEEGLSFLRLLAALPGRTDALLQRIEQGHLEVQMPEMKGQFIRLEHRFNRLSAAILFAALLICAVQLYLAGAVGLAAAGGAGAFLALVWVIIGR
ncbi:MAG: AarF/ABC1/UbiB kinase family protein [Anaerolineaceae bacterium]|nr:AarF/ABC1/UbiB kinase family protein [Anaerolineaceae bacterium]